MSLQVIVFSSSGVLPKMNCIEEIVERSKNITVGLRHTKKTNNLQFVFIHQYSPHTPFAVTENCKQQVPLVINFGLKYWEKK